MNVSNLLTILLLGCVSTLTAKVTIISEFTKFECEIQSPEIVVMFNCYVNRTSKSNSSLYAEFEMSDDLFELSGVFHVQTQHAGKLFNYTTQELDYCEAWQRVQSLHMVQVIAVEMRRSTNLPLKCPVKKHTRYYVNHFKIDPKVIPSYLPQVSFRTEATFMSNKRKLGRIFTYGNLGRK